MHTQCWALLAAAFATAPSWKAIWNLTVTNRVEPVVPRQLRRPLKRQGKRRPVAGSAQMQAAEVDFAASSTASPRGLLQRCSRNP